MGELERMLFRLLLSGAEQIGPGQGRTTVVLQNLSESLGVRLGLISEAFTRLQKSGHVRQLEGVGDRLTLELHVLPRFHDAPAPRRVSDAEAARDNAGGRRDLDSLGPQREVVRPAPRLPMTDERLVHIRDDYVSGMVLTAIMTKHGIGVTRLYKAIEGLSKRGMTRRS